MSLDLSCPFCGSTRASLVDPCPRCDVLHRAPVFSSAAPPAEVWGSADVELTDSEGAWAPEELELARAPVAAPPPPRAHDDDPLELILIEEVTSVGFQDEQTEEEVGRTAPTLSGLDLSFARAEVLDAATLAPIHGTRGSAPSAVPTPGLAPTPASRAVRTHEARAAARVVVPAGPVASPASLASPAPIGSPAPVSSSASFASSASSRLARVVRLVRASLAVGAVRLVRRRSRRFLRCRRSLRSRWG
jgi:hypothetical protein